MGEAKGLIITGAVTLFILFGGIFFLSKNGSNPKPVIIDSNLLIRSNSHKTASTSANPKVTIVEFGDYQCPACGVAYPITKEVLKNYGNNINFVFRNFPLPQHKNAPIAAEAAEAAGAQGKFWEMHDKLYEVQNQWDTSDKPLDKFLVYAKDLKLDEKKFKSDVESSKYSKEINADVADGTAIGINATPTFYVNGQALSGIPTYEQFKSLIDTALSKN